MPVTPLKLFVTVYNDARLIHHFLRHYEARGVTHFFIAVGEDLKRVVDQTRVDHPVSVVTGLDVVNSVAGTAAVSAMRAQHHGDDEWAAIVDLDEFVECQSLPDIIMAAEK